MRRAVSTMVSLIAVASAQSPPRAFEAASIKPSREAIGSSGWDSHPASIVLRGQALKGLIAIAYKVKDTQIVGGPKWLDASRFDINARASAPAGDDQLLVMLQGLLAQRFQLVMRSETRTATGYALVIAKGGLKIQPVQPRKESHNNYGRGRISARGITMAALAEALPRLIENPVSGRTSALGVFDFQLEWPTEGDATEATSALSSVLREQLGLNLEIRKVGSRSVGSGARRNPGLIGRFALCSPVLAVQHKAHNSGHLVCTVPRSSDSDPSDQAGRYVGTVRLRRTQFGITPVKPPGGPFGLKMNYRSTSIFSRRAENVQHAW